MSIVTSWLENEKRELGELLGKFGADSEQVRELTNRAVTVAHEAMAEWLQGKDTTVAQNALRAVRKDLTAITTMVTAAAVMAHIEEGIHRLAGLLMQGATTALVGG